jgi:ABC-type transporter Mla subunit MlaD
MPRLRVSVEASEHGGEGGLGMTINIKIETIEDLQAVVDAQNASIEALGTIIQALDPLVRTLDAMLRSHHETIVGLGDRTRDTDARVRQLTDVVEVHQRLIKQLSGYAPAEA